jgi:hypothetical protein
VVAFAGALFATAACAGEGDTESSKDDGSNEPASSESNTTSSTERPVFDASFAPTDPSDAGPNAAPPSGGSASCVDDNDPGGSENLAKQLPPTDDCDNSFKTVKGVLDGAVDVDFYKLSGSDKFLCSLDTEFSSGTASTEICVYARCKNATANAVSGCKQGTEDSSVVGMKGCCAAGPGKATPSWDCSGITDNDSADFLIRIRQEAGSDKCLPYSFSYRF